MSGKLFVQVSWRFESHTFQHVARTPRCLAQPGKYTAHSNSEELRSRRTGIHGECSECMAIPWRGYRKHALRMSFSQRTNDFMITNDDFLRSCSLSIIICLCICFRTRISEFPFYPVSELTIRSTPCLFEIRNATASDLWPHCDHLALWPGGLAGHSFDFAHT